MADGLFEGLTPLKKEPTALFEGLIPIKKEEPSIPDIHAGLKRAEPKPKDTREWEFGRTVMPPTTEAGKLLEKYRPKLDWKSMFIPPLIKERKTVQAMEEVLGAKPEVTEEFFRRSAELVGQHVEQVAKTVVEVPARFAYGFVKGKTFYAPELIAQLTPLEIPEPVSTAGMISEQIGSLFGLWDAIAWMNRWGPFAALDKLKPASKAGVFAKRVISSGLKIGTYSILSEHGGDSLQESMIRRGISGATGAGVGAFFGMTSTIATTSMKPYHQFTAFAMRLGLNEMITGLPAYRRWQAGEAPAAQVIYEAGLGLMFSLAGNPLKVEAEFNRAVKEHYKIKELTREQLLKTIEGFGQWEKVPSDIKWAYIMKATDGKLKPNYQNVNSTDPIFKDQLRMKNRSTFDKMRFVEEVRVGIEKAIEKGLKKPVFKTTTDVSFYDNMLKDPKYYMTNKGTIGRIEYMSPSQYLDKVITGFWKYTTAKEQFKNKVEFRKWFLTSRVSKESMQRLTEATERGKALDMPYIELINKKGNVNQEGVHRALFAKQRDVKKIPVLSAYTKEARPDLFEETTFKKFIKNQEAQLATEMATGKDIAKFKRTARAVKLVYKSKTDKEIKTNLNKFLQAHFGITSKDVGKLSREQIEEARQEMKRLVPGPGGQPPVIPTTRAVVLPDFAEWTRQGGNPFDWVQTARMPLRPIHDVIKPAYENFIRARQIQFQRLNEMYGGRVRKGSAVDIALAKYADGKAKIDAIPKQYRDIAHARKQFYNEYADLLLEKGLIPRNKVFNKDGTRKPYYHRIFEAFITQKFFKDDFRLDDMWLPGQMPLAGPLRKRMGGKDYKYSAIESDTRYVYAMEKYINMAPANKAGIEMAGQLRGMRKDMANVYLRSMRGQPTKIDRQIKESTESIMHGLGDIMVNTGLKSQGQKLKEWRGPAYPVSRVAAPIARFYYWRYVGLALDTSMKNAFQWHHAIARYGPDNVAKAFYMQHTPEGKRLIEKSGIMRESIQRGGHFVAEAGTTKRLSKIEENSYWLWSKFDTNNRGVSGLAAYYNAIKDPMTSPQQALEAMRAGSHETQYGYTKADSLLMDMANPLSRFILFKKWPLAKVEMMRQWVRDGNSDAVLNLALTEYLMYKGALRVGVDLTNYFGSIWQLATRGIEKPAQMIPMANEIMDIYKMFGTGAEARKAKERVRRAWQGLGNRYLGKVVDVWKAWKNDWEVRDSEGGLMYKTTPKEQFLGLITKPLEKTKRYEQTKEMLQLADRIKDMRRKIMVELLHGSPERAAQIQLEMFNRYGEDYQARFGKELKPITSNDVMRFAQEQEIPVTERIRRRLPGKGVKVPPGAEFPVGEPPPSMLRGIRGY